ncbi:MAG: hypothetical protein OXM02_06200 [Bacteroidota bacterium]|nr:hypothetical protein [Bacteroidota bacterium]MDE2956193.1 hypothetical protein [Bacteroidota bacterium]
MKKGNPTTASYQSYVERFRPLMGICAEVLGRMDGSVWALEFDAGMPLVLPARFGDSQSWRANC